MMPRERRSFSRDAARIAAGIAIVAGVGGLWRVADRLGADAVAHQRFEAQRGRLSIVRLADGSRVTLAAGSTLDVPETFDERRRDVFLAGQAFFEIATDSARPFRVHARNAVTEVLGTKFGVRAYAEDSAVTVVVAEGRVAVGASEVLAGAERGGRDDDAAGGAPVHLAAGDRATLGRGGRVQVEHDVAVGRELAWMQGALVFAGAPLDAVAREIERWYDVEIVVADSSLLAAPVHASFGVERVERVMRVLAGTLDAELEMRGDSAWLRRRR
jgi:transmembrane sensor